MTGPSLEDLSRQLGALAMQLDRVERDAAKAAELIAGILGEQEGMRNAQRTLAMTQGALTAALRDQVAATEKAAPAAAEDEEAQAAGDPERVEWLTVADPNLAAEAMTRLLTWVEVVWSRYAGLSCCWPWHPDVVAELLACRGAWREAHKPKAPLTARADWHARWREAADRSVRKRLAACDDTTGHKAAGEPWRVDPSSAVPMAMWWAARGAEPAPGLTAWGAL